MKMYNKKVLMSSILAFALFTSGCSTTSSMEQDIVVHYKEAEKAVLAEAYDKALNQYSVALECLNARPNQTETHITKGVIYFNMGFCHEKLGAFDQALDYYNKSRLEEDTIMLADIALGSLYFQLKEYDISKSYYEAALEYDSEAYEAYVNLSAIYSLEANYEKALTLLTKAIEIDPSKADAYINRAYLFASIGDDASMNQDIQRLKDMKFNSLDVYVKIFNDTLREVQN